MQIIIGDNDSLLALRVAYAAIGGLIEAHEAVRRPKTPAEIFANGGAARQESQTSIDPPAPTLPSLSGAPVTIDPPAPTLSNPNALPPTTPPPPAAGEVDSAGAPFDPNIHSSSRKKNSDGTWKKRRGGPAGAAPAANVPPPPAVAVATAPPPPPAAPAAVPPPPPPGIPGVLSYRELVAKCFAATQAGKLTNDKIVELCRQAGAPDLTAVNAMPAVIPTLNALLDAALMGAG